MKFDKQVWIPRAILLFFTVIATSASVAGGNLSFNRSDIELWNVEIYAFFSWISFFLSFLPRKWIALSFFAIHIIGMVGMYLHLKYITYYCWATQLPEFYLLFYFYLPMTIIIGILFIVFTRKRKVNVG